MESTSIELRPAPRLAIVIPCYNEEEALPITLPQLLKLLDEMVGVKLIAPDSYILFSNDGSRDRTWQLLRDFHARDSRVHAISLAHNRGHQYALLAGLMEAMGQCDAAVSIDADLQDDPNAIKGMVELYRAGSDIVYGVRSSRKTDTFFKRTTAHAFYKFQQLMGLETVYDHADYRLMSNFALELLSQYHESNIFLRGIVPQIGLSTSVITYERASRVAGESKYPLSKMLALSIDGITSFSAKPMRWIFFTGLITFVLTLIVAVYVLISHFYSPYNNPGWASTMLSIWGLGSLILISIGITGEYIGKIFVEVKARPRYAVKERI